MKRPWIWVTVVALLVSGWWWRGSIFPGESARVRKALDSLAAEMSFTKGGGISTGRRINALVNHFAPDAVVQVEILGAGTFDLNGRAEIQQAMWGARRAASSLQVRFFDILIEVDPEGRTATAHLSATAVAREERRHLEGFEAIELRFQLRKLDGEWKVGRVETVPTLKQ